MALKAGVAVKDITPTKPLFLVGYPHVPRTSTGVHDRLSATALYLENQGQQIVSIATDIIGVNRGITKRCRQGIHDATGIPMGNIMLTSTHTHSGPKMADGLLAWKDDPTVPKADTDYVNQFCSAVIAAGIEAYQQRQEAALAVATANAAGVGGNRHRKDGVADPEVGLVYLKAKKTGKPLALQMIYCMHPTVLHEDSTLISGDFPDYARKYIAKEMGAMVILYHTGPSGNQSPRYHVTGQTFAEAQRLGEKLGQAVVKSLKQVKDSDFRDDITVGAKQSFMTLPGRKFCSVAEAQKLLDEARADFERLKRENAGHGPIRTAECTVFGAEERLTLAKAQVAGETAKVLATYNPIELQVFKMADTYLVGIPGECFVEYDLDIKKRASGKTFVTSLANEELQGYIVTPDATGYEAGMSFFLPTAGQIMADTAVNMIKNWK